MQSGDERESKELARWASDELRKKPLRISLIYGLVSTVWIEFSGRGLSLLSDAPESLARLERFKGFFFVATSALLLYVLLRRMFSAMELALFALSEKEAERKRFARERRRVAALVDSADAAIVGTDLDGRVTSWNPAASAVLGYEPDEALGREPIEFVPKSRRNEEIQARRAARESGKSVQLESERVRKDGTRVPVSVTFSPLWTFDSADSDQPEFAGLTEIVRDISEQQAIESRAREAHAFADTLIESMPGIFYFYDTNGHFLRWNRNFETASGYSGEEISKMHPLDFFDASDRPLLERRIGEVFSRGESNVEAGFLAKNGEKTPYFFTGKKISFEGRDCLLGVGVDICERVLAEEEMKRSEERFRTTLDTILEGCQLLSFDWRYVYLNGAAAVQNRRPNSELLGKTVLEAWPGIEVTEVFRMMKRCMFERTALHDEVEFEFPDGHRGWFDVRCQPVPEGIFLLSIDISERKRAENRLRELNESLEQKIVARTKDLAEARERAESADRLKSAFLATMSHELRTPLNSIIGFTGIVLGGMAGPLAPEQSKQLGMVRTSARHLLDLINDVLDISKIEAGQLEMRPSEFELGASLEKVRDVVSPLAEKKGIALTLESSFDRVAIESDQRRVEQIALNLVNNAVKFTERGEVRVRASADEREVRIEVSDTGIGMRAEDLTKLFQPFRQLDSGLGRQHEGAGLGLAICRRLTDLLGGRLEVRSVEGAGSTFTLTLPREFPRKQDLAS